MDEQLADLAIKTAKSLQTRLSAKASSVVLVGKDGKEKLCRVIPLSSKELFEVVDAMQMRRAEMRKRP